MTLQRITPLVISLLIGCGGKGDELGDLIDDGNISVGDDGDDGSGDDGSGDDGSGDDGSGDDGSGDDGSGDDGSGDDGSGDDGGDPIDGDGDGYTAEDGDCDDGDRDINPDATEVCDGVDNNCDGDTDEGVTTTFYADTDTDSYGDPAVSVEDCSAPSGYVTDNTDCDDGEALSFPGNPEVCDGLDNDCDTDTDEGVTTTFYADTDTDSYGDPDVSVEDCSAPSGYVADNTDCDDGEALSFPGNPEVCDGIDNDCDADTDEGVTTTFYADTDSDSYGDSGSTVEDCAAPSGYVADDTDCDDGNSAVNPGAPEICDGVDNDCDASTSEDATATFTDSSGTSSDVTSTFAGDVTLSSAGTYTLCDGSWAVNIDIEADVTLQSANGAASTSLDGAYSGSVIDIGDGYTVSVDGFTIFDGYADGDGTYGDSGGGVYCSDNTTLSISNSAFVDNVAYLGAGVGSDGCDIAITDTSFEGSLADYGGDLFLLDGDLDLSGIASTNAEAYNSGSFAYVAAISDTQNVTISGSSIDDSTSYFNAIYVDGSEGYETTWSCFDSSFTNHTVDYSIYAMMYITSGDGKFESYGCDFGTSAGGDDNDPADVFTYDADETYSYDDDAWFTCTTDGCEDYVVYTGAAGTYTEKFADVSTTPGALDCNQLWDIVGTGTDTVCDSCDFAFDATWTLDTGTLIDSDCTATSADFTYGIGFASSPAFYSSPVIYLEYYGLWYPLAYGTLTGNSLNFTYGGVDYSYDYYGTSYYFTNYRAMDLTLY